MNTQLEQALAGLAGAAGTRGSPYRNLTLATIAADGAAPELRTVVLRGFDAEHLVATVHADRRSAKIGAIAVRDVVELLAWDPEAKLQTRMRGTASVHVGDTVARAEWDALSTGARRTYALRAAPGAEVSDAEADARGDEEAAWAQFAVLRIRVVSFDILELGPEGAQHRIRATPREGGGFEIRRIGA